MDTPWPERFRASRKRLIGELTEGRKLATQLQNLLMSEPCCLESDGRFVLPEDLVVKILRSFTRALTTLSSSNSDDGNESGIDVKADHIASVGSDDWMSQDSGKSTHAQGKDHRRRSYKRRHALNSRMIISKKTEDGYAWRKYGQKAILNAKYPRCYFRCSLKHEKGCKAIKQVQKIAEDEKLYRITYFGYHTCTGNPLVTNFEGSNYNDNHPNNLFSLESKKISEEEDNSIEDNMNVVTSEITQEEIVSQMGSPAAANNIGNISSSTDDQHDHSSTTMWSELLMVDLESMSPTPSILLKGSDADDEVDHEDPAVRGFLRGASTRFLDLDLETLFKCG